MKAPAVNNSFSVTCQGPAASNEVSLGQGKLFHLCLLTPLSTVSGMWEGRGRVRAFSFLGLTALCMDVPGNLPQRLPWLELAPGARRGY